MLSRREVAKAIAALVVAGPLSALAQHPPPKIARIGYLEASMPQNGTSRFLKDFRRGLRDLGYVEGTNIRLEVRFGGTRDTGRSAHATPTVENRRIRAEEQLPAMYETSQFVEVGGLMSYGPNTDDLLTRAATYVERILRGAKPGDLPIEQPATFELVINLNTAKALGVTIPSAILFQADRVIQ
jgi:hypothetical protein